MRFTFVDLFSGIGGFHIAASKNGGVCVQACDISPYARNVYLENYRLKPHDDIATIKPMQNVDLVTFGSPCQPYSIAGMRKGLADDRGEILLDHVVRYLKASNAKAFIMENVKGLLNINNGNDFKTILQKFQKIGYKLKVFTLNATQFGIPQNRERVYVVGHKKYVFDETKIRKKHLVKRATDLLDTHLPENKKLINPKRFNNLVLQKNPHTTKSGLMLMGSIGRGYTQDRVLSSHGVVGALIANWSPVIYDERFQVIRELSNRELFKFQGFPNTFRIHPGSRKDIIKAAGNAVCVPVVKAIIKEMINQSIIK